MTSKKIDFSEVKPFMLLVSKDFTRFFVVCEMFFKHEKITQDLGGQEHIYLKENNQNSHKLDMDVFRKEIEAGHLLLLN